MATFPTLTPSSRSFTPGRHPHSEIRTLNGLQTRVRTSNVILEQRLRLTFVALTEAQMLSIRSHYSGQQGRFLSFDIPTSLLSGMATPANFTPTGYSWIYAGAPQVEDIGLQRYTVSVELVTVPPEGANINGSEYTLYSTVVGATATSSISIPGVNYTVPLTFQAGVVADNTSAGFDRSVPITFTAGTASATPGTPTYSDFLNVRFMSYLEGTNGATSAVDSSAYARPITFQQASISTAEKKFGTSSLNTVGQSAGAIAVTPTGTAPLLQTNFTVEAWYNFSAHISNRSVFSISDFNVGDQNFVSVYVENNATTKQLVMQVKRANAQSTARSTLSIADNVWVHIALTKQGNTFRLFADGVLFATHTAAAAFTASPSQLWFGQSRTNDSFIYSMRAYMDDARFIANEAIYIVDFVPPQATLPRDGFGLNLTATTALEPGFVPVADPNFANVSLLLHFNGNSGSTTIPDTSSTNSTVTTFGNAAISANQAKFGGGSLFLDGTGDYIRIPTNAVFAFGTGDFTIEFWTYRTGGNVSTTYLYDGRDNTITRGMAILYPGSSDQLSYYANGNVRISTSSSPTLNAWSHVAVSRAAGVTKMFLNGTQIGSNYTDTNDYLAPLTNLFFGAQYTTGNTTRGYFDELRVTKGVARYTANFTPPIVPFSDF